MTLRTDTHLAHFSPCEAPLYRGKGHAENNRQATLMSHQNQKDNSHEYCEQTQIIDWENEGGANTVITRSLFRGGNMNTVSFLSEHIETAEAMLDAGNYNGAVNELESAAQRFMHYRDEIDRSFGNSIARLSTLGCPASPPHPKAMTLVEIRRKITA